LIKRTSIKNINKTLNENPNWRILDIGCGYRAHSNATVIADVKDLSTFYKDKNFIKINDKKLPFKNKEFDFVIASHVIEHIEDFEFFLNELERVSSKGYIELPTKLGDNLVIENKNDHIWWFSFDDINKNLIASKKSQLIEPFLNVSTGKIFEEIFRDSLILEIYWEEKINYIIDQSSKNKNLETISFFKLIRKYFSKKIRSIIKKN
tara:strand:+ start:2086 stop:2706 length:621 start_codon:yes stop_codon:yes gene_type:complete